MNEILNFSLASDTSTLLDIQRHFIDRTLNLAAIQEAVIGIACVIGGLLLFMLFLHFRPRKPYIPQDWVTDPARINDILDEALSQRAKFELQFATEGDMRRPALRCALLDVKPGAISLESSGLTILSNRWVGKNVDCFFLIRRREGYLFYAFSTIISGIESSKELCLIKLATPERLEGRQKRSYLRIVPPEEFVLGAAVWRGQAMPAETVMNDLAQWPKPARIFLPGIRADFSIRDVSSGGLRLHIPRHLLPEEMDYIHVSARFIVMLDLWDPDKSKRIRYWLLCRMQSPVLDFETKGMDIGAQFLSWAKPVDNGGSTLHWFKLASSGEVEPLGNWIMRRHLEYFRETEQVLAFTPKNSQEN